MGSRSWLVVTTAVMVAALATAVGVLAKSPAVPASDLVAGTAGPAGGVVAAVGAENQYADVIAQIGGSQVHVTAVMSNPNTDPHTFEVSPEVAQQLAGARLVVQNGLGYDPFMTTIERASPSSDRMVIDVQRVRKLPDSTPNPHLWYTPATMPAVAQAIATDLGELDPGHRAQFQANLVRFDRSLGPWRRAMASLEAAFPGAPVATTEPVADDMLEAVGARNLTPFAFQADVMNGVDPSPQDVAAEQRLLTTGRVEAFVYNRQVTDTLTASLLALAKAHRVPVVGVYETMPTPGYHYQSWMVAEVDALHRALATGQSSPKL